MIERMDFPLVHEGAMAATGEADRTLCAMSEEEFHRFYERTARPLWAYLSRVTGSRELADDLLQEAYYRFYRAGAQHESEAHRRNSLFRIATNLMRDAARRSGRAREVPLEDESTGLPQAPASTPAPEAQAAMRTDLQRAMNLLEPLQRQLLWLAYGHGASHEEIAEIVGVRAISVRTLLLRARRKVAAFLTMSPKAEKKR